MSNDKHPEPNWRLLAVILCLAVLVAVLGLIIKWW
jgi:hypothetical protein